MLSSLADIDFLIQAYDLFFLKQESMQNVFLLPLQSMQTNHVQFCLLKENDNDIAQKLYSSAICL